MSSRFDVEGHRQRALQLCNRVKDGRLTVREFNALWPRDQATTTVFMVAVRADLEDAVEHFPGSFLTGQPLWGDWYGSELYKRLVLDEVLLGLDESDESLARHRQKIIDSADLPRLGDAAIEQLVFIYRDGI